MIFWCKDKGLKTKGECPKCNQFSICEGRLPIEPKEKTGGNFAQVVNAQLEAKEVYVDSYLRSMDKSYGEAMDQKKLDDFIDDFSPKATAQTLDEFDSASASLLAAIGILVTALECLCMSLPKNERGMSFLKTIELASAFMHTGREPFSFLPEFRKRAESIKIFKDLCGAEIMIQKLNFTPEQALQEMNSFAEIMEGKPKTMFN